MTIGKKNIQFVSHFEKNRLFASIRDLIVH
ncbi:hypothetical protein ATK78_1897 [Pedobacter metabolipauper]|uniref:Uncharacterized protein n=1 Tax=Pedobacter metabolipauper TaxID=425513 RepID=A0A4R6SWG9_9SPHI|nr:hypothetical protein ATK78_1897 [Pedobacter metabolipauper]